MIKSPLIRTQFGVEFQKISFLLGKIKTMRKSEHFLRKPAFSIRSQISSADYGLEKTEQLNPVVFMKIRFQIVLKMESIDKLVLKNSLM